MTDQSLEPGAGTVVHQAGAPSDAVVVLTTAPEKLLAMRIVHCLVEESLVACGQVGAVTTTMYQWQGKLDGGDEYPVTLKTTTDVLPALYARLCELHPYEIPEFLVVPVMAGSRAYLDWAAQATRASAGAAR